MSSSLASPFHASGVQGALRFVETILPLYVEKFNFIVCPCACPWGYETINRWNHLAIDPNRSFVIPNTVENNKNKISETTQLIDYLQAESSKRNVEFILHMDLHETTDTDVTTFGFVPPDTPYPDSL
jgi:hypothetical protein